jgi:hypothetical protein
MKWTVSWSAEAQPGTLIEQEVVRIEREDLISPTTFGVSIAEGKRLWRVCGDRS